MSIKIKKVTAQLANQFNFIVEKEYSKQRIDKYLVEKLSAGFSRTAIKKIILDEFVRVNNKVVTPHFKIKENDRILVNIADKVEIKELAPCRIPVDIIYEDEYLLVVNKPAGMVVHPGPGHYGDTLVNALIFYTKKLSDINGPLRLGVVHRLDKDTSGVLVIAKDNKTHRLLADQFKQHTVKKIYIAVVEGKVELDEGIIDAPISRSLLNRKKMAVLYSSCRKASTYYRVLKREKFFTVLEVQPKTGRTHQIRLHLAYIGHPILADKCYGNNNKKTNINRQALHAKALEITHPVTGKFMEFESPLPEDIVSLITLNT